MKTVKVFGPATVANLGPGFDLLGIAVTGCGDLVEARRIKKSGVVIESIVGDEGRLPLDPKKNTVGVAAQATLDIIGTTDGVALKLHKGMPLGSGLGSSAASAAAAVWAVAILHDFTDKQALLPAGLAAEAAVSGYHADNVAPALLGGLIFIQGYQPLRLQSLPVPPNLYLVLVTPDHEIPTSEARSVVPQSVPLAKVIANAGNLGALIAASYQGDVSAFGRAVVDDIIEPARSKLIPGFAAVKAAALEAGGHGCSIGGSGPTVFAICDALERGNKIGQVMKAAFQQVGLSSRCQVASIDLQGARQVADDFTIDTDWGYVHPLV